MRKIITTTFITLDGVMQAPGGREEDTTSGFEYGGWQLAHPSDDTMNAKLGEIMTSPFELLLGRKTYDIFASYWPTNQTEPQVADPFNKAKKYVVSHQAFAPAWANSTCVTGDVVAELNKLKEMDAPDLWVWGSGELIQTLLKDNLIDRMSLWIYPITIGKGKKLFAEGTQPENFKLVDSYISTTGVILASYEPAGPLQAQQIAL
jgi:dihydrofolate reductase